jgi:hypothetical protein
MAGNQSHAAEERKIEGHDFPKQGEMSKTRPHDHGGALRQGARAELVGARSIIDAALRFARGGRDLPFATRGVPVARRPESLQGLSPENLAGL